MSSSTTVVSPNGLRTRACGSLLERLRSETAEQHRELENTVDISRRLADRDSYEALLAQFYGFYRPLELRLAESPAGARSDVMLARLEKAAWLAEDLTQLGVHDIAHLPQCAELPPLDTWSRALGTMYVLEGSTLGGRHISTLLTNSSAGTWPRRFFTSYGPEVGGMWRSFCAVLDELSAPEDHELATENARATFDSMRVWLRSRS